MSPGMPTCYRHPDRETGLSCSECGRPICTECMTVAPVGLRCPDHAGARQPGQALGRRRNLVARAPQARLALAGTEALVTKALIALNVGIYLVTAVQGPGINTPGGALFDKWLLFGPAVANGDWWRLITAAFLHGGVLHLGINMLVLWWFGPPLEEYLGRARFIGLYLAACLAGSAGALLQAPLAPTVGASGAFFGILGAMAILEWQATGRVGGNVAALIAINLALSFAIPNVSWGGHVGGLIGGTLVMLAYSHWGKGHAAYGRLGLAGILGVVLVSAGSVAIAYWKVRGYA